MQSFNIAFACVVALLLTQHGAQASRTLKVTTKDPGAAFPNRRRAKQEHSKKLGGLKNGQILKLKRHSPIANTKSLFISGTSSKGGKKRKQTLQQLYSASADAAVATRIRNDRGHGGGHAVPINKKLLKGGLRGSGVQQRRTISRKINNGLRANISNVAHNTVLIKSMIHQQLER